MSHMGLASLPLHGGKAPQWLIKRMASLADCIFEVILDEYGSKELLFRISDPFWFQSLACVLGYDWHSSGTTTVLTGVMRTVLNPEKHHMAVAGGKGKRSKRTPSDLAKIGVAFDFSEAKVAALRRASRLIAKVDNAAIQDGYHLYHHTMFITDTGEWAVVQQGMSDLDKSARRYHWLSSDVQSFVANTGEKIACNFVRNNVLDMTAGGSAAARNAVVDLISDNPTHLKRLYTSLVRAPRPKGQASLDRWLTGPELNRSERVLHMPWRINWEALQTAYELQLDNFEGLLLVRGVGPATVRGLALMAEVIWGNPASWQDPCKFAYAVGGKDGVPFP
ncbi:MAG: DUF763 domain-containing protein, partial [Candidatus Aenigmarchaeota archaeon]|nr:DUF763 domain-containing protein [Candidatus Aenigmarchaeota archaeon]